MISLSHPATGHQISVDDKSADFWKAAGYRETETKSTKTTAKKASSSKSKK